MTREELDVMWHQALHESIAAGEKYARYHFAALVAEHERAECAKVCESLPLEWPDQPNIAQAERATLMDCVAAIRSRSET